MKTYIITYDLRDFDGRQDHMSFYDAIKSINFDTQFQHFCESAWVVKTDLTAQQITDKLLETVDKERVILYVAELNTENHAGWIHKPLWKWFRGENDD